jgi:hypothetical protein
LPPQAELDLLVNCPKEHDDLVSNLDNIRQKASRDPIVNQKTNKQNIFRKLSATISIIILPVAVQHVTKSAIEAARPETMKAINYRGK